MTTFGIDIGCTAIKYGEVTFGGEISAQNFDMLLIPQTQRTEKYTAAILGLLQGAEKYSCVGIGFPSVVNETGILNLDIRFDDIWQSALKLLAAKGVAHFAINDADAAGFAELYRPGAAELRKGVTIVVTLGTGIGSAVFTDGKLLPNSELGMIEIHGIAAELYAAPSVKHRDELSLEEWAGRLQEYITQLETILTPDHIVLGGGISSDFEQYRQLLSTRRASLDAASFRNQAGVIGAAMYAAYRSNDPVLTREIGLYLDPLTR